MSLPGVIPASQVNIFRFYDTHGVHEATIYRGTVLRLCRIYPVIQRNEAYEFAFRMSQGCTTVLSPSSEYFRIWIDINFAIAANVSQRQGIVHINSSLSSLTLGKVRSCDRASKPQFWLADKICCTECGNHIPIPFECCEGQVA